MTIPGWEDIAPGGGWSPSGEEAARFAGNDRSWDACTRSIEQWFGVSVMAAEYNGDKDYGEAHGFDKGFRGLIARTKSAHIIPAIVSYSANMERVAAMHTLPLALIYWVARTTKNACAAAAEAKKPVLDALSPETQRDADVIAARLKIEEHESQQDDALGVTNSARATAFGDAHLKMLVKRQLDAAQGPAHQEVMRDYYTIGGIESILFSMVTSSYAAFETLAADLWIDTLNKHPTPLAVDWCDKNNTKKIALTDLASQGFNVSGGMGNLLVEIGASFAKLAEIKSQYCDAFGHTAKGCFEPGDMLYLAAKVRNLIAHRGGIVDARFKKEVASFPAYADQRLGGHLSLTGSMVRELVDACVGSAVKLTLYVDHWTVSHAHTES